MQLAKCVTDSGMRILDVDDAFAEMLHKKAGDLSGANIYDITHPDDLGCNRRLLDKLRKEGTPFSITKRYVRDDGSSIWVSNHVSIFASENDGPTLLATVQVLDAPSPLETRTALWKTAQRILRTRRRRSEYFGPALFGEPDFDILLDLFVQHCLNRTVSITSACIASAVPATTALRYIGDLVDCGLIKRVSDPRDKRRCVLALTDDGHDRIRRYLEDCQEI